MSLSYRKKKLFFHLKTCQVFFLFIRGWVGSYLLGTIIGLANALDYQLVAEGVETKEQALIMHGLGCQIIQGYFFSRPVASDKIPELIEFDFSTLMDKKDVAGEIR